MTNIYYTNYLRKSLNRIMRLVGDGLLCALLVPAIAFAALDANFNLWRPAVTDELEAIICNDENKYAQECFPELYELGSLELSGVVFASVVWYASNPNCSVDVNPRAGIAVHRRTNSLPS